MLLFTVREHILNCHELHHPSKLVPVAIREEVIRVGSRSHVGVQRRHGSLRHRVPLACMRLAVRGGIEPELVVPVIRFFLADRIPPASLGGGNTPLKDSAYRPNLLQQMMKV